MFAFIFKIEKNNWQPSATLMHRQNLCSVKSYQDSNTTNGILIQSSAQNRRILSPYGLGKRFGMM